MTKTKTESAQKPRWALLPFTQSGIESRTDGESPVLISGYGAVYYNTLDLGSQYRVDMDMVERFRPGCFDAFLASDRDCICAPHHDESKLLGRRSRLLRLSSDDRGLRYSLPYDESDPDHVAIGAKLRRGDVTGSSAQFVAIKEDWSRDPETDMIIREIITAEVYHLGPVVGEAYNSTTAEIRSEAGWEFIQERKAKFLASEQAGFESLMIEIDSVLLD